MAILDAARELFTTDGMRRTTISEIARRAEVSQVSIYNYFGSKESLAGEVFTGLVEAAISDYERILSGDLPFAERMTLILHSKAGLVDQVATTFFTDQALDDKVLVHVFSEAIRARAAALYENLVESGKREGAIDPTIPTDAIVDYLMMSLSMVRSHDYFTKGPDYEVGMIKLFLRGVLGGAPERMT